MDKRFQLPPLIQIIPATPSKPSQPTSIPERQQFSTSTMANVEDAIDEVSVVGSLADLSGAIIPITDEITTGREIEASFLGLQRTLRHHCRESNKQMNIFDSLSEEGANSSFIDAKYFEVKAAIYSMGKISSALFSYVDSAISEVASGSATPSVRIKDEITSKRAEIEALIDRWDKLELSYAKAKSANIALQQQTLMHQGGRSQPSLSSNGNPSTPAASSFKLAPLCLQNFDPGLEGSDWLEWLDFFTAATDGLTSGQKAFYL